LRARLRRVPEVSAPAYNGPMPSPGYARDCATARWILLGASAAGLLVSCGFQTYGVDGAASSGTATTASAGGGGGTGGTSTSTSSSTGTTDGAGGAGGAGAGGSGGAPPVCGDGVLQPPEACEDGNADLGDGCSGCMIEKPFTCTGEPSTCTPIPPQVVAVANIGMGITDSANHYDGSIGTMDCATVVLVDQGFPSIQWISLTVGIDHPYVGDLVLKLVSPQGTVSTMMNRPGLDEPTDKYDESNGHNAKIEAAYPVVFNDGEANDAETMGNSGGVVCKDDQRCSYAPNPGSGPGLALADFKGESPAGSWKVCLADGDDNDVGKLQSATLEVLAW